MWAITLVAMLAVVITERSTELYNGYEFRVVHGIISRAVWALGLSWIIYSSYYGYGGKGTQCLYSHRNLY